MQLVETVDASLSSHSTSCGGNGWPNWKAHQLGCSPVQLPRASTPGSRTLMLPWDACGNKGGGASKSGVLHAGRTGFQLKEDVLVDLSAASRSGQSLPPLPRRRRRNSGSQRAGRSSSLHVAPVAAVKAVREDSVSLAADRNEADEEASWLAACRAFEAHEVARASILPLPRSEAPVFDGSAYGTQGPQIPLMRTTSAPQLAPLNRPTTPVLQGEIKQRPTTPASPAEIKQRHGLESKSRSQSAISEQPAANKRAANSDRQLPDSLAALAGADCSDSVSPGFCTLGSVGRYYQAQPDESPPPKASSTEAKNYQALLASRRSATPATQATASLPQTTIKEVKETSTDSFESSVPDFPLQGSPVKLRKSRKKASQTPEPQPRVWSAKDTPPRLQREVSGSRQRREAEPETPKPASSAKSSANPPEDEATEMLPKMHGALPEISSAGDSGSKQQGTGLFVRRPSNLRLSSCVDDDKLELENEPSGRPPSRHVNFYDGDEVIQAFTPYSKVYGSHPAMFDFDDMGNMVPPVSPSEGIDFSSVDSGTKLQCTATCGVGYRRKPVMGAHVDNYETVPFGETISVEERDGDWVRDERGWLPLMSVTKAPVFDVVQEKDELLKSRKNRRTIGTPRYGVMVLAST